MGLTPAEWALVALMTVSASYQYIQQKKMQSDMERKAKDAAAMRDIRISGSNNPVPISYGYARLEGIDVYANVSTHFNAQPASSVETLFGTLDTFAGKRNNILILQKVLSNAPLSNIIYAEISEVDYDKEEYLSWIRLYVNKTGGSANAAILTYHAEDSTFNRDSTATFDGLAYSTEFFRMNREAPQFDSKPSTSYYTEGKPIRTFSGSTLSSTKSFSNNSAEVLLDYLLDSVVGVGMSTTEIDLVSFGNAARICNEIVKTAAPVSGKIFSKRSITTLDIKRHQFNGNIYPDQDHISNIETILETIPGAILFRDTQGKLKLAVPDSLKTSAEASVGTINDDLLISDIQYSQPDSDDKLNQVKLTYASSGKDFASDSFEYKNPTYLDEDNGIVLSTEITMAGISNVYQASGIAKAIVNETRVASYNFEVSHQALFYEPGDVIRLQSDRNEIDRYVRITSMKMNDKFGIEISAIAYDPSIYVYDSTVIENNYNRPTFDFSVGTVTGFGVNLLNSADSFISSIEITWTDADDINVAEYIIDAGLFINDVLVYNTIGIVPAGTQRLIHSPTYPATYYYRIRSRTGSGRMSPWSTPITLNIEPTQVVNGLSILFSTYNLEFKRDIEGNTTPTTQSATISLVLGNVTSVYQTGSTLGNNEWKIISPLTGDLSNGLGTYAITITDNIATIVVSPDQAYTGNDFGLIAIPVEIKYNNKASPLSILDPQLFSISRSITVLDVVDGVDGNDGAVFKIASSSAIFKKSTAGAISPETITLTTFIQNVEGTPSYTWFKNNVPILGANTSSYVVNSTDYASISTNTYKCTVSGMINGLITAISDEVTIPLVVDGTSAVQVFNSNQSVTFAAPSSGFAGIDFDGGSSTITVFIGDDQLAYSGTGANTFSCVISTVGVSVPAGIGSGNTFTVPEPTSMSADVAYADITVSVRNAVGNINVYTTRISYSLSRKGSTGNQNNIVRLYQWSTVEPANPNGSSQYSWISGTHTTYTGSNGWSTTVAPNPGTPLIKLWEASKQITATAESTITAVDWTTGVNVQDVTQNGAAGTRVANAVIYRWEPTIPLGPTGVSTYTWSTGGISPVPSSWSLSPGTSPSPGYTLWSATVPLIASAMDATSDINWTTAGINAAGYAGDDGAPGANASLLYLSSSAETFTFNSSGTADPSSQTISFVANLQNTTGTAVFTATRYNSSNAIIDTVALGGTGNTRTLTVAQFGAAAYCVVTATLGSLTDTITVVSVADGVAGQNAVVGYLTNESVTVAADNTGTVSSFTGTGGTFKVFNGLTDVTGATGPVTYSVVSSTSVTISIASTGIYTVTAMSASTGTATLRAVFGSVTIDKVYTIAKAVAGATGGTGSTGAAGASARVAYARINTTNNPVSNTVTVNGDSRPSSTSSPQTGSIWGTAFNVTWYTVDPDPASTFTLWQSDGIYNPSAGQTVWATPYISNLKVGTLSAITANTGNLNVSGQIKANTAVVSGTTMTGAGGILNSDGSFAFGNATKNLSFNTTNGLTINGDLVVTGNITAKNISDSYYNSNASQIDFITAGSEQTIAQSPTIIIPSNSTAMKIDFSFAFYVNTSDNRGMTFNIYRGTTLIDSVYTRIRAGVDLIITRMFVDSSVSPGSYVYKVTAVLETATTAGNLYIPATKGVVVTTLLKR